MIALLRAGGQGGLETLNAYENRLSMNDPFLKGIIVLKMIDKKHNQG
jgi:hypothetical protein